MTIYKLTDELAFPNPELSDEDGLLAIGGDLEAERILLAYCNGIFPWYSDESPILWWSPNPRFVLYPEELKISKSMGKLIRRNLYKVTIDTCFREVITECRETRHGDTWITPEMLEAYCELHDFGFAHSIETWFEGNLVGGLYGISLGSCFFGESMFSKMDNASKIALITLTEKLKMRNFTLIDCQVYTKHLESLGAVQVDRKVFLKQLYEALQKETLNGNWINL